MLLSEADLNLVLILSYCIHGNSIERPAAFAEPRFENRSCKRKG